MDIIGLLIPIMENLIAGCCFYKLANPFMECKKKTLGVGGVYFVTVLTLYIVPLILDSFLAYGIGSFAGFLVMCLLERKNYRQKAFIAVTFFSLRWFTLAMAEILYDMFYAFAEKSNFMLEHPELDLVLYIGVCVIYLVLEYVFMDAAIKCILKSYVYKYDEMSKKELVMLTMPSFMGITGCKIMWYYRHFFIAETRTNSEIYDVFMLLYYAAAIASVVVVIVLYQQIKQEQEKTLQNEMLAAQMENIRHHIEQVENLYRNIRSIKHDMTNHIITLERLYSVDKKEAKAYSDELRKALSKAAGRINSGNPVTDVILQEMQDEARRRQIDFKTDFHYPAGSNVNAFDLSVILNNALQNALEYADKSNHPVVSIISYCRGNAYMIEVSNSFTGNLKWDEESGLPMTSKGKAEKSKTGTTHGYGLSNIRRVALKYSGDIAVDVKDGMFCLCVLLMVES